MSDTVTHIYGDLKDPYGLIRAKKLKNRSFFFRKSNSDPVKSVSVTYKDGHAHVGQLKMTRTGDIWYALWEDEDEDPMEVYASNIRDLANKIFCGWQLV